MFAEYPKWIAAYDGKEVIVQDADEEKARTTPPKKSKVAKDDSPATDTAGA